MTHHEALLNAVLVVDDFGDGGQAIGGAGGIAKEMEREIFSAVNLTFSQVETCFHKAHINLYGVFINGLSLGSKVGYNSQ